MSTFVCLALGYTHCKGVQSWANSHETRILLLQLLALLHGFQPASSFKLDFKNYNPIVKLSDTYRFTSVKHFSSLLVLFC